VRVGVLAYLLQSRRDYRAAGVSVYTEQLLRNLSSAAPHLALTAFVPPDAPPLSAMAVRRAPISTHRSAVRIVWEQAAVPWLVRGQDVVHSTVNTLPLMAGRPTVLTIHDLSFLRFPDRLPPGRRAFLGAAVPVSARRATRVIAISESTKRDIVELLRVPEDRIRVVHQGVDARFRPGPSAVAGEYFGGRPYILHVGTLEPRKNIDLLVRAFSGLRRDGAPHVLALIGARGWMYEPLFHLVRSLGLEDHVRFLDYVPPDELPRWYNGADLFAYPSAYEGFGLPVLEAMACGVPTVTSNASSLGEVAGTAALTVEAGSDTDLRGAMARVLENPSLAANLRQSGLVRAREFTWEKTARRTAEVYEEAARG